jgi:transcriptional antiterminator
VRTEGAGTSDVQFFQEAIEKTQETVTEKIEEAHTDGGFHSPENQGYCADEGRNINFILGKISGKRRKYDLSFDEKGKLIAVNRETGERVEAERTKRRDGTENDRWRIKEGDNVFRYFTREEVMICALRKKIESFSKETLNIRNNVEATIMQLGYHFRHDKSKYRGLIKHRMWALNRCIWINFRRIAKWLMPETGKTSMEYAV